MEEYTYTYTQARQKSEQKTGTHENSGYREKVLKMDNNETVRLASELVRTPSFRNEINR